MNQKRLLRDITNNTFRNQHCHFDDVKRSRFFTCFGEQSVSRFLHDDSPFISLDTTISNVDSCPYIHQDEDVVTESIDCIDYSVDVATYMRSLETKYLPNPIYMRKQPDLTFDKRAVLVNWMSEVVEEYQLETQTLFLAVNYVDRFFSRMAVQESKIQLVGTTSLCVAAKFEEICPPEIHEFAYVTDDSYTRKQVLTMEKLLLNTLEHEVNAPTACYFINHYSTFFEDSDKSIAKSLALYLSEMSLVDGAKYIPFRPSVIGAAAVSLARFALRLEPWTHRMSRLTGIEPNDFRECFDLLQETLDESENFPHQAVRSRYSQEKHHKVGLLSPKSLY